MDTIAGRMRARGVDEDFVHTVARIEAEEMGRAMGRIIDRIREVIRAKDGNEAAREFEEAARAVK